MRKIKNLRNRELNSGLLRDRQGQQPLYYCGSAKQTFISGNICDIILFGVYCQNSVGAIVENDQQDIIIDKQIQQMKESRVREFNNIRNKNLSQTNSQVNFSLRTSNELTGNLNFKKANMQKKKPICLDCVNTKIITQKKQKAKKQKQELIQVQKGFQKIQLNQSKHQQYAAKLLKQSSTYNQKVIQERRKRQQFQKSQDQLIMKTACQLELKAIKGQESLQNQATQRQKKYRQELQQQYKQQTLLKQSRKKQRNLTEPDQCIIPDHNNKQQYKKYRQQLKKQIKQENVRKQQAKVMEVQVDKQSLANYEKDFLKYTEFIQSKPSKQINPELFEEMKLLQTERKLAKIEQRELQQRSRKEELMNAKKQAQFLAQKSLKNIKSYASVLSNQIQAKKRQEEYLRKHERQIFSQQVNKQHQTIQMDTKPCGQCCKAVEQRALSYY